MKDKLKEKNHLEVLFRAYEIGGFPLVLLVLGAIVICSGVGDSFFKLVPGASPVELLFSGIVLVVLGVVVWSIRAFLKNRTQVAVITLMRELLNGATKCSQTGGDFQSALRDLPSHFGQILSALGKVIEKDEHQSA